MSKGKRWNLTDQNFGLWTVLRKGENIGIRTTWICQCECGTIKQVATECLTRGQSKSCGCSSWDYRKNLNLYEDLTGQTFNRLTVLEFAGRKNKRPVWKCVCECGNTTIVYAKLLKNGHTKSCGCLHKEQLSNMTRTHGKTKTRLYNIWNNMKSRCLCKTSQSYKYYGSRGVQLYKEWEEYIVFEKWALENGYSGNLSIDRIDVNGNYEPSNCRWITMKEQARNKRNNVLIEYNGEIKLMADWSRYFDIRHSQIQYYLKQNRIEEFFDRLVNNN